MNVILIKIVNLLERIAIIVERATKEDFTREVKGDGVRGNPSRRKGSRC